MDVRRGLWMLILLASVNAWAEAGQVVEKDSNAPIEGVTVIRAWRGVLQSPVQATQKCFRLDFATTDAQGRFSLPRFAAMPAGIFNARSCTEAAYKPGYHMVETNCRDRVVMARNSGTRAQQFAQVMQIEIPFMCPPEDVLRLRAPVLQSLYQEGLTLADSDAEFESAEMVMNAIESLTLGQQEADRNFRRRLGQRSKSSSSSK
jgi:hypothetical protein